MLQLAVGSYSQIMLWSDWH